MSCPSFNCSLDVERDLEQNPDISGLGVVVGFTASGWAVLVFLIVRFIIAPSDPSIESGELDRTVRGFTWRILRMMPSPQWTRAMETVVLAMSDQQLVTGFAIMIGGYSQLRCGLSFYHWRVVTALGWFSSVTHLATLLFLRQYMQRNRSIWYARALLMAGLGMMLVVGIFPTGVFPQIVRSRLEENALAMPASCIFEIASHGLQSLNSGVSMILSEVIIIAGFLIRLIENFSAFRWLSMTTLRTIVGRPWRRCLCWFCDKLRLSPKPVQLLFVPLVVVALVILISMQAVLDVLVSDLYGLLWLLFSLTWGTIRLLVYRRPDRVRLPEANVWDFGQLVAVMLLVLPVLLMTECFSEIRRINTPPKQQNSSASQIVEQQQQIELAHMEATEEDYNLITSNAAPLSDPQWIRIRGLCERDFRTEPWYTENLFLIIICAISVACVVLILSPLKTSNGYSFGYNGSISLLVSAVPMGLVAVATTPLCGILSRILRGTQHKTTPPFVIRIAIDSETWFRVPRWIYILCMPITTGLVTGQLFMDHNFLRGTVLPSYLELIFPAFLWTVICLGFFICALCIGLFHIFSEIL